MIPLRDRNPTRRTPVITLALIALNVAVYLFVQPQGLDLLNRDSGGDIDSSVAKFNFEHAAIPCEITTGRPLSPEQLALTINPGLLDVSACKPPAQSDPIFPDKPVLLAIVFSMFFHGNLLHLGGNMLFLWIFGNNIEDRLGVARYLGFYLLAGLAATLAHIAVQPDSTVPIIGASGAVAGVMGAYLVWYPNAPVLTAFVFLFIFLREIAAKWLLAFWFVSQFFVNPNEGVAWAAHVGGFIFGAAIALLARTTAIARNSNRGASFP
ncbi:MAG: rhomboid family intramembrane serine protease [Acidimicrobiales bacterium]